MGQILRQYVNQHFSISSGIAIQFLEESFSPTKQLTPEDIFFKPDSAVVLVQWSKTLQFNSQVKLLHIPLLNNSFCPVTAIKNVINIVPTHRNSPLFQFKTLGQQPPMTDNQVRSNLENMLQKLHFPSSHITFHSFRRSGATLAFNNNVPMQAIKQHGI